MISIRRKDLLGDVNRRFLISTRDIVGNGVGTCSRFIYECCFANNKLDVAFSFEIAGRGRSAPADFVPVSPFFYTIVSSSRHYVRYFGSNNK